MNYDFTGIGTGATYTATDANTNFATSNSVYSLTPIDGIQL